MSKPNRKRYVLESVRRSYAEALDVPDERVEFEVGDGKVFHVPHPIFMPSAMQKELNASEGDEAGARILLGDQWQEFIDAGGDATSLILLYTAVRAESQDTVQKHRPTKG